MRPTGRTETEASANERGSALLIVFVFAAIIAIMLYAEMPVNVFEAQRNKEQLLVDRGSEYAHAVKLYYRKFGIFPPTMDALENTNRMRFLRHKFKDPFTGENDWRILHAGPAGQLIDSKVNNGGTLTGLSGNNTGSTGSFGGGSSNSSSASGTGNSGFGSSNSGFGTGNSGFGSSNSGFGSNSPSSSNSNSSNGFSGYSGGWSGGASSSGVPGQAGANPAIPQRKPAVSASAGGSAASGGTDKSVDPTAPLLASSTEQGSGGNATGGQANGATGAGSQNGSDLNAPGGTDKTAVPGNSTEAVRGLITNPNGSAQEGNGVVTGSNSGAAGTNASGFSNATGSSGTIAGGGIAGVASKVEGRGIKTINDQTKYSLWEFYYDPSKDAAKGLAAAAQQGTTQTNGQNATNGVASPTLQNSFGSTPGTSQINATSGANAAGNGDPNSSQQTPPQPTTPPQ